MYKILRKLSCDFVVVVVVVVVEEFAFIPAVIPAVNAP